MAVMSTSSVSVALPTIGRDLNASSTSLEWIVYLSAYFQQVQGRSALGAGLAVLPVGLGFFAGAQLSGRLVGRLGPRSPMIVGLCLCGAAMIGLVRLRPDTPLSAIWWDLLAIGFGGGLCLTPMTATAMAAVRSERAGMASAVHNSMRQVGQALGVAVLGSLVYAGVRAVRRAEDGCQVPSQRRSSTVYITPCWCRAGACSLRRCSPAH